MVQSETAWIIEIIVQLFGIFVSGVLTLGLVILYSKLKKSQDKQNEIQQTQTKLMKNQEKLMEAELMPKLRCVKIRSIDEPDTDSEPSMYNISMVLENNGRGAAKNIRLRCDLLPQEDTLDFYRSAWPENKKGANIFPALGSLKKDSTLRGGVGEDILMSDRKSSFKGNIRFRLKKGSNNREEQPIDEDDLLNIIEKNDCYPVPAQLSIIYKDAVGNIFAIPILSGSIEDNESSITRQIRANPTETLLIPERNLVSDIENGITDQMSRYSRK
jgi:hypothetical protein